MVHKTTIQLRKKDFLHRLEDAVIIMFSGEVMTQTKLFDILIPMVKLMNKTYICEEVVMLFTLHETANNILKRLDEALVPDPPPFRNFKGEIIR